MQATSWEPQLGWHDAHMGQYGTLPLPLYFFFFWGEEVDKVEV